MMRTNPDTLPDGYRMTELGPLPEEWRVVRLGEIASIALGRTPSRAKAEYWEQGEVPWVSIADLTNGPVLSTKERISRKAFADVFRNQAIPAGTLLFSFKLTIGKVGILGLPAVHNEAIASLFVNESLASKDFLFFLMQSLDFSAYLDSYVKGRTLNKEKLGQIPLPLPPLAEQRAIAHVLRTVQATKEANERVVEALRTLKKSLMRHLFTYGPLPIDTPANIPDNVGARRAVPLRDTELGPLPAHWKVVRLGEVVEAVDGGDWGYDSSIEEGLSQAFVLRGTDFAKAERGDLSSTPIRFLKARSLAKRTVVEGDVLVELSGGSEDQPTGRILYVSRQILSNQSLPVAFSNFVKRLRVSKGCDPSFFAWYWRLLYQQGKTRAYEKRTTGIRNFKLSDFLANQLIPLPPLDEQREITRILQAVDRRIQMEETYVRALQDLFRTLLHELMTGRRRVPVDIPGAQQHCVPTGQDASS